MGIPRLSQDLSPYAERVSLGSSCPPTQTQPAEGVVTSLVVDGPSLVYSVYNKLLAYRPSATPTYEEINEALLHLLSEFTDHGVDIQNLFFDGALPTEKRHVRAERMEKLRHQLETYRQAHPGGPPTSNSIHFLDCSRILWNTPVVSSRRPTLPAPPFMVASAIESLLCTAWKDRVQVVPDEADAFCANAARDGQTAVLTNDSDLTVHDLGPGGRVILLHSVEKTPETTLGVGSITALALTPSHIAQRLGVTSLPRFGFERFLDPSASIAIVKERARDEARLEKLDAEYVTFLEQYSNSSPSLRRPQPVLNSLDPRIAELVVDSTESPHMYLTPLLEDPSRDSSWSYGTDVRQLAYTILFTIKSGPRKVKDVVEYARKGQRITSSTLPILPEAPNRDRLGQVLSLLGSPSLETASDAILHWHILATSLVHKQKSGAGKSTPTMPQIARIFGLQPIPTSKFSWDDIHLLGNIHAVLYSLRILKQITRYALTDLRHKTDEHNNHNDLLQRLHLLLARLELMPAVQDLFLDVSNLHRRTGGLELGTRNIATQLLREVFENPSESQSRDQERPESPQPTTTQNDAVEWATANKQRGRGKRKRPTQAPSDDTGRSKNIFNLLPVE